jgi:hypothetical protein
MDSKNVSKKSLKFNTAALWLYDQSKITNYAKRTQFPKKSNIYNRNFNNELQRKTNNGHLVKTNPNEANFTRHSVWRVYLPMAGKIAPLFRMSFILMGPDSKKIDASASHLYNASTI